MASKITPIAIDNTGDDPVLSSESETPELIGSHEL